MAAFTPGNIVVYRVGTGAGALGSAATAVFLDEYTPAGTLVQSIALPTTDSGLNQTLTASGSATSEGLLDRSADGRFIVLTGYDAALGTASVASSSAGTIARVIGRVGSDGTVDTSTTTTAISSNNVRSAASVDGSSFFVTGGTGGVVFQSFGGSGAGTVVSNTVSNLRDVSIFDGQLYVSTGSGSAVRIGTVGTGTPATTGQTISNLPGFPTSGSPYQFVLLDLSAGVAGVDTLYVADDTASGGQIQKYTFNGTNWTADGAFTAAGARGLTASVSGGTVTLFATSSTALLTATDSTGYDGTISGSVTTLATASINTALRGVAFAPENQTIQFALASVSQAEGNSGTTAYTFQVTRTGGTTGAVNFGIAFAAGTTNAADFAGGVLPSGLTGTIAAGASSTTVTINVAGDTTDEANESFTLTLNNPTNTANFFVGLGAQASTTGTITNDDAPALENQTVAFSAPSFQVVEGNSGTVALTFTVTRTGGTAGQLNFGGLINAGQVSGSDLLGGTVPIAFSSSIAAGQTTGTVTLTVVGDTMPEPDESLTLTLNSATNASANVGIGAQTSATGTIVNDDLESQLVAFSPGEVQVLEGNSGTANLVFTVTRTGGTAGTVNFSGTVNPFTSGATADDFAGGTLPTTFSGNIPAGQASATVTLTVAGDTVVEANERVGLTLTNVTNTSANVSIGMQVGATGTIVNDDALPGRTVIGGLQVLPEAPSLQGAATTPTATDAIQLVRVGATPGTGATASGRAESISYDPAGGRLYVTNNATATKLVDVFQINADATLTQQTSINLTGLTGLGTVNSVAVKNGVIAVAYDNATVGQQGYVALYDTATQTLQRLLPVGVLPDQLTFSPDGQQLVVANEAEPVSSASNQPGGVTIISLAGGAGSAAQVGFISFRALNGFETELRAAGVPIFPGQLAANDIEPEYVSISPDGTRAYVTLQEVNAVAVIDLTNPQRAEPLAILPLGYVDRSLAGNAFDPSDQNGVSIANWPVRSLLQPDAIATFSVGGQTYFITANEGDARVGTGLTDEVRLSSGSYVLDPTVFPNAATLKQNGNLGRLNVLTTVGDIGGDNDFDQIYTFGGRGFSIFRANADGTITKVRETGGEFEAILAANHRTFFNTDQVAAGAIDDRSDNKGPEPEGVTVGVVNGRTYAFITLERAGGVMIYDVTDPANANFVGFRPQTENDLGPETLVFIAAADNPTGQPLVVTANEVSGTTTVYRVVTSTSGTGNISGDAGNNAITGGAGNDLINASQGGSDTIVGGDGNDGVLFGAAFDANDYFDGGAGTNDQVGLQGNYTVTLSASQLNNVEVVALLPTAGAGYTITTTNNLVAAGVTMTFYASELAAGQNFTFNGAAETDGAFRIYGGLGTDVITTGSGNDGIYFGQGRFDPANDRVNAGPGTNDQLALDGDYTITLNSTSVQGVEVLALLDGRTGINSVYNITLDNSLVASGATFTVSAVPTRGGVRVDGSGETDALSLVMFGGTGGDTLIGGSGADRLVGNAGSDTLRGNGGADRFEFQGAALGPTNVDTIQDFVSGTDNIALSAGLFTGLVQGGLNPAAFLSGAGATAGTTAAHRIIYDTSTGALYFDQDGDGALAPVQFATLTSAPTLAASDFLIIA